MRRIGSTPALGLRLAMSYAGLAAIALMVWLSGGGDAPYAQLFLLAALYTCAVHPARRVLAVPRRARLRERAPAVRTPIT